MKQLPALAQVISPLLFHEIILPIMHLGLTDKVHAVRMTT